MDCLHIGSTARKGNTVDGFDWIQLDWQDEADRAWLRNDSGLDSVSTDALLDEYTRPRAFSNDSGDWIVMLRCVATRADGPPLIASLRLCVSRQRVITVSRVSSALIPELALRVQRMADKKLSSARFLLMLCDALEDQFTDYLAELEERVGAEEEALAERDTLSEANLRGLRLETSHLRRHLSPMREALQQVARLIEEHPFQDGGAPRQHNLHPWREIHNSFARNVDTVNGLNDRLQILRDALRTRADQRLLHIMYLLTLAATFFLPLTFVASLLGMNVGGIPGQDHPWGFWTVSGGMVALAIAQLWLFRRWRWLDKGDA